jgi:hypothetical protein
MSTLFSLLIILSTFNTNFNELEAFTTIAITWGLIPHDFKWRHCVRKRGKEEVKQRTCDERKGYIVVVLNNWSYITKIIAGLFCF